VVKKLFVMSSNSRTASEVRSSFLSFFAGKGHEVCASAPLIPQNDPTLMFTNAGMVPFKDVFIGKDRRPFTRATSSQKCIRISGKHNDLENVGVTARHHTFFEMLGNFSFGDYFKDDAIPFAWELITKEWGIDEKRLVITVFGGAEGIPPDDEARAIWKKVTGFSDDRIIGIPGMPGDNFWQMGETGPCGPCTELHFFTGDGEATPGTFGEEPTPDGKGWMEIWNLVFMQFNRTEASDGRGGYELAPLPKPSVDTGAGLERVTSVLQGKTTNYDTDLLRSLVEKASSIAGKDYRGTQSDDDVSMRVIADHARLTAFLISEGIFPDRAGRPYVLRRVMRRAIRHGHRLGIAKPFLHEVALEVVSQMGDAYPELVARRDLIASIVEQEEVRFRETIDRGLKMLDEEVGRLKGTGGTVIPGDAVFKLYDTYGFPMDLTEVIARERSLTIDIGAYEKAMAEQKARSEAFKMDDAVVDIYRKALDVLRDAQPGNAGDEKAAVRFSGYESEEGDAKVLFLAHGPEKPTAPTDMAKKGDKVAVVVDETPFYAESGGQVGDKGQITTAGGAKIRVHDTQKPLVGLVVHLGEVIEGEVKLGETVHLVVDHALRTATRRNHSATHLLHWALRKTVGETATQKGSLVGPDRLRFDYSAGKALTADEIQKIEDLVNEKILVDAPILTEVLPQAEAKKRGAMAIFEEKYGDVVRVLTMTSDSVELCGGTHARSLGEIGLFKVLSDSGIAAGVRRIEATTGMNALGYVRQLEGALKSASKLVKAGPNELPEKIERLIDDAKKLEKELSDVKRKLAFGGGSTGGGAAGGSAGGGGLDELAARAKQLAFGKAIAAKVDVPDGAMLRELAEKLRDKLGDAVVLLGSVNGPKAQLVCTVSKSLTDKFKAGDLIRPVAQILGGSGGGRPDMAQAGGTDIAKLDEALEKLYALVT
jgi:alanyl-tRNA synthetase